MKYSRFEWLILVLGSAVVFASVFMAGPALPALREVIGQLLIVGVLIGAVHWGRDGGFVAAIVATLVYVVLRIPMMNLHGLSSPVITMVLTRVATYVIVGIVGGEICGRIKYILARVEDSAEIDDLTSVFNGRHVGREIKAGIGQFRRYQTPFSIVRLSLAPSLFSDLKPSRQRSMLRTVATHIRNDVRLVDDVGYIGEGVFGIILPSTPASGAEIAADRVRCNVRDILGARDDSVTSQVLSLPTDTEQLCDLSRELDPAELEPSRNPCILDEEASAASE